MLVTFYFEVVSDLRGLCTLWLAAKASTLTPHRDQAGVFVSPASPGPGPCADVRVLSAQVPPGWQLPVFKESWPASPSDSCLVFVVRMRWYGLCFLLLLPSVGICPAGLPFPVPPTPPPPSCCCRSVSWGHAAHTPAVVSRRVARAQLPEPRVHAGEIAEGTQLS